MKNYFKFLVPLVVILSLTTDVGYAVIQVPNEKEIPTQSVDRLQTIKDKGVLTVLSSNNEPYSYKNPRTGEFSGIDAEIIREVAKRLGVKKVDAKYSFFFNLFEDLVKNPDIDLVADGIFITDQRKQLVDFTIPIYSDWGGILTRKDSGINSKEDLKRAIIGEIRGEVYDPIVEEWKKQGLIKDYIIFSDRDSLKIALKSKIIDASITDSIIAQNILIKNPELNFKLLSPTQYVPEIRYNIGYPLRKGDTTLLNAINEKLQDMKNDGTLYEILTNYGIRDHYIP